MMLAFILGGAIATSCGHTILLAFSESLYMLSEVYIGKACMCM